MRNLIEKWLKYQKRKLKIILMKTKLDKADMRNLIEKWLKCQKGNITIIIIK